MMENFAGGSDSHLPFVVVCAVPTNASYQCFFCFFPSLVYPSTTSFDIMPLPWFSSSALHDKQTQSDLQTQFGHQKFLNEQTSDVVCAALMNHM